MNTKQKEQVKKVKPLFALTNCEQKKLWSNRVNSLFTVTNCEQSVDPVWPGLPLFAISKCEHRLDFFLTSFSLFVVTNCERHRTWALGLEALINWNKFLRSLLHDFFAKFFLSISNFLQMSTLIFKFNILLQTLKSQF